MEHDLCPIGRVVKSHGVRGKVKVAYFGTDPGRFPRALKVFIKNNQGKPEPYEVLEVTPQPPRLILRLKGIDRVEETENLIGKEIFIPKGDLPLKEEGEYYWYEIIGMKVETEKGKRLGTVKGIFPTGAHDVYVVEGRRGEIFLPAAEEVIKSIDCRRKVMTVLRMEGLWEEDDEV